MVDETLRHYGRLATGYDNNWTYNQTYIEEFTRKLRTSIDLHRSGMLIAMLPTSIDYPLFSAALRKFAELQPDPQEILNHMISASLDAHMDLVNFTITIERRFPQPILRFQDNFAFLIGRRRNI